MLKMLVHGYFIYCVFFQTVKIFSTTYNECAKDKQGFAIYIGTLLFVILSVALVSLVIGFIASLVF